MFFIFLSVGKGSNENRSKLNFLQEDKKKLRIKKRM